VAAAHRRGHGWCGACRDSDGNEVHNSGFGLGGARTEREGDFDPRRARTTVAEVTAAAQESAMSFFLSSVFSVSGAEEGDGSQQPSTWVGPAVVLFGDFWNRYRYRIRLNTAGRWGPLHRSKSY
jgi:hypothetical protein